MNKRRATVPALFFSAALLGCGEAASQDLLRQPFSERRMECVAHMAVYLAMASALTASCSPTDPAGKMENYLETVGSAAGKMRVLGAYPEQVAQFRCMAERYRQYVTTETRLMSKPCEEKLAAARSFLANAREQAGTTLSFGSSDSEDCGSGLAAHPKWSGARAPQGDEVASVREIGGRVGQR
jgi:hypothetical protein